MHPTSLKRFNVTNRYDKGYNQNIENEPEYLNTSRTHLLVKVITITLPSSRHLMLSSVLPGRFLKLLHCLYIIIPTRFPMSLSCFSIHGVFTGIILDFATALRRKLDSWEWKSLNTCLGDQIVFPRGRGVQTTIQLWTPTVRVFYSTIKLLGLSVEAQIYRENDPSFTFALSIIFKHNL